MRVTIRESRPLGIGRDHVEPVMARSEGRTRTRGERMSTTRWRRGLARRGAGEIIRQRVRPSGRVSGDALVTHTKAQRWTG